MGKKNKKLSKVPKSTSSTFCEKFTSLEDEIIQNFQLLKEAGCLVIGLNAVLRGLRKKSFCVIILISRKATSAMYHALNMMCKNTDVIFLQLKDIDSINSFSKIPSSTAYGIKTKIFTEEQKFEKLIEKINRSRSFQKSKKQRNVESLSTTSDNDGDSGENHSCIVDSECTKNVESLSTTTDNDDDGSGENHSCIVDSECTKNVNDNSAVNNPNLPENQYHRTESSSFIHTSHDQSVMRFSVSEYGFLTIKEIDFPDYNLKSNEVSFRIK